jgi:hypothetical protein
LRHPYGGNRLVVTTIGPLAVAVTLFEAEPTVGDITVPTGLLIE